MKLNDPCMPVVLLLGLSGALANGAFAQNSAAVIATASFISPIPMQVAPGEIITVYAAGLSPTALPANADHLPLPTVLGGIRASIEQFSRTVADVPLLSVFAVPTCPDPMDVSTSCTTLTAIRLQIPYEAVPAIPDTRGIVTSVRLFVSDQAGHSVAIDLAAIPDHIHLLTEEDVNSSLYPRFNQITQPLVTHADGSLVTSSKPAKAGEQLVAYAVGLGRTDPPAATGAPSPSPAPRARDATIVVNYVFSPNALPSSGLVPIWPVSGDRTQFPAPLFAGLSPGSVGLYQLNFIVPPPPAGTPPCEGVVVSNLTVSFVGGTSLDGAPICVAVP